MPGIIKDIGDSLKSDYEGLKSWAKQIPGDVKGVEAKQETMNEYKNSNPEKEAASAPEKEAVSAKYTPTRESRAKTEQYIQSLVDKENARKPARKKASRKRGGGK